MDSEKEREKNEVTINRSRHYWYTIHTGMAANMERGRKKHAHIQAHLQIELNLQQNFGYEH